MAVRNWNPNEPFVLGLEWAGMRSITLPLSQEVEYGHTFQADATETIDTAAFEIMPPSVSTEARNTALTTVYRRDSAGSTEDGDEMEWGAVTSTLCAVNGGSVSGGATLIGGATVAACLVTPSDANYVECNAAGETVNVEFATAGLFTGKRILELKLHYVAQESGGPITDPTMSTSVFDGATNGDTGLFPIDGSVATPTLRTGSLGEIDYASGVLPLCWPWTVAGVQAFDTTKFVRFNPVASTFNLHYVVLEVTWCEENRAAVAGLLMGSVTGFGEEPMQVGRHVANFRTPAGVDNWAKVLDDYYAVTVTAARSSGLALRRTQGGAPLVPLVDAFDVFEQHQGRVSPRLPSNVLGSTGVDSRVAPIKFVTTGATIPTDFAPYDRSFSAQVQTAGAPQTQGIQQRSGGGTVEYPWIRFYARIIGDPQDVTAIDITHDAAAGAMNYFESALLALPEIFDGWRAVTLRWPGGQEPQIDNSGTIATITFDTTQGNAANRWEILGVDSTFLTLDVPSGNGEPTYGDGGIGFAEYADGVLTNPFKDLVVTLHTDPPQVTGLTVVNDALVLHSVEDCVGGASGYEDAYRDEYLGGQACDCQPCSPANLDYLIVDWATPITDGFAHYEVQRMDPITAWETIALLEDPNVSVFNDFEARVGQLSTYQVRVCRTDGICEPWSATGTGTVPTTNTPDGTLLFTSNTAPAMSVAYTEVFDSSPEETFGFVEADSVVQQRFYGRYGTQSFHPTERGGVTFERTMLINSLTVPTATADRGCNALRDLAWADVPNICVRDDQGNRWYSTVIVPNGSVVRAPNLYVANVRVVESALVPFPVSTQ